jgi:hypothetical protein
MLKQIISSILFIAIVLIVFLGIRVGLIYLIDNAFFPLFDYFNKQKTFMKIIYLFLSGGLLLVFFGFVKAAFVLISSYILDPFRANYFTLFGCAILSLIFSGITIFELWKTMCCPNFWKTIEFLMIASLVFSINHAIGGFHIIKMKEQEEN